MTVQEMIQKIPELSLTDRKQLMHALIDSIPDDLLKHQNNDDSSKPLNEIPNTQGDSDKPS